MDTAETQKQKENLDNNNHGQTGKLSKEAEDAGLKVFPERRGDLFQATAVDKAVFGFKGTKVHKFKCEKSIMACIEKFPLVKHMISSLESKGCPIDYRRHFSCEYCAPEVTGGYDPELNQIIVCYNRVSSPKLMQGVIAHELLHMYDYCTTKMDFYNIEHIACSEIRAANLMHCSLISSFLQGHYSIKKAHQLCVKTKAMASIIAVRPGLSHESARKIVDKVFKKCYNDLEPVGRRPRRDSGDMDRIYRERFHCGYGV